MGSTAGNVERSAPRFETQMPCWLRRADESAAGVVLNVSESGLFVRTPTGEADGQPLGISLWPRPDAPRVELTARVIWREPATHTVDVRSLGVGLEIETAPDAYYDLVQEASGLFPLTCARCRLRVAVGVVDRDEPKHPFAYYARAGTAGTCSNHQEFLELGATATKVPETCPELGKTVLAALTDGTLKLR
ncbi:MAG: PilZ domain-containing protein [Myxococcota bacterium]